MKRILRNPLASLALVVLVAFLCVPGAEALEQIIGGKTHLLIVKADPVLGTPLIGATPTNRSGTIAAANVSQQLMAANANRRGFMVQNSGAAVLWINELGAAATAAQPSIQIAVGATYVSPPDAASPLQINILGGTLSQAFTAREW